MAKVEVIETTTERRRSYSRDEKAALLAECEQTTMSAVARRHGIARSVLQSWKARRARVGRVVETQVASAFVRLEAPKGRSELPASSTIRVASRSGLSIELPAGIDLGQLAVFVRLLEGAGNA